MTQEILHHFGNYIKFKYGDKVSIGYGKHGGKNQREMKAEAK